MNNQFSLYKYGGAQQYRWTQDQLWNYLTSGKRPIVTNDDLLKAMQSVDRVDFIPDAQLHELAYEDRDLHVGYQEDLLAPSTTAKLLAQIPINTNRGKYLVIGAGTGYLTTILGKLLLTNSQVFALERIQRLWELSRYSAGLYQNENVKFLYRDGLPGIPDHAPYDSIILLFDTKLFAHEDKVAKVLRQQLKLRTGRLIIPQGLQLRLVDRVGIDEYEESILDGFVLKPGKEGLV